MSKFIKLKGFHGPHEEPNEFWIFDIDEIVGIEKRQCDWERFVLIRGMNRYFNVDQESFEKVKAYLESKIDSGDK